jgi:hypothetical protein
MNAAIDGSRATSATPAGTPAQARGAAAPLRGPRAGAPATPAAAPRAAAPQAAATATASAPRWSMARLSLMLALLVILVGWAAPLGDYITPRTGLGYTLGIVGGSLMLALLIYPARKRLPGLTRIGSARAWFRIHMVLGVVGPICILYHCNFHLGAANSNVALVSMLIVAGSGIIGRYLYERIHHGLYGRMATLEELRADTENLKIDSSGAGRLLPEFGARLDASEKRIGYSVPLVPKALTAALLSRFERMRLHRYVHKTLRAAAAGSPTIAGHRAKFVRAADRYSDARLKAARRVAEFESCRQLFSLWHLLHLPLFGMLFIAAVVHVVAVNVY